jgi:hypothetical protein
MSPSTQAAATTCYAAVHPALAGVSGKYFADCNEASPSKLASSSKEASRLWSFSEGITDEKAKKSVVHPTSFRLQVQNSNRKASGSMDRNFGIAGDKQLQDVA